MRKATRTVASWLGVVAGLAGLEHGYFEVLQGNTRPEGLMIVSMGPPCVPEEIWNACEPAMTILPSFLLSGILSLVLGVLIIVWSIGFVQRKHGGWVLILLSAALLLFGGGLFPPLIGLIGGAAGTQINKPLAGAPGSVTRFTARLWSWPLVVLMVWLLGQFPVGYLFNDFLKSIMYFGLVLILTMLPLSVYTGYAY
ncbi:MAG: hypothetical protein JXB07_06500, partial [Anaerolineae bacterium]|nr:hypothetical protein [Anaerolineae bacterium]